ncbi:hypothetical protein JTB14_016935 [Gonioctena quinquepunctata]|nr:hypothetical protein JTB14_016935 [Gonioctena quinquepunctata]
MQKHVRYEQSLVSHFQKDRKPRDSRHIQRRRREELDPISIADELIERGFNPRVVARFKNRNGQNMPIILVTVPDTDHKIKEVTQICEMEVHSSLKDRENESDSAITVRNSDTIPTTVTLTLFVGTVQDHMNRDNITRKLRPPINAATVEGLTNQIEEDVPIFLLLKKGNFRGL